MPPASQASKPVRGSVPAELASAAVDPVLVVVEPAAELEPAEVVVPDELDVGLDAAELPLAEPEAPVEDPELPVAAPELDVPELPLEEPEPEELGAELPEEPDFEPERGSTYCWSPADGPAARAAAGASSASATSARSKANVARGNLTGASIARVAPARGARPASAGRRGELANPCYTAAKARVLQDVLQPSRRQADIVCLVLGCSPPHRSGGPRRRLRLLSRRRHAASCAHEMLNRARHPRLKRQLAAAPVVWVLLLGSGLVTSSPGDLQGQIAANRSAATSLGAAIAGETAQINATAGGLQDAQHRLAAAQVQLASREADLSSVQRALLAARNRLVELENRLQRASLALASNLRAEYEGSQPDLVSVILEAHGFRELLEQVSFLRRMRHQDAQVIGTTRIARAAVAREATALAALEKRDRALAEQVLAQRNQIAALRAALLGRQIAQLAARSADEAKLRDLNARVNSLEERALAEARRAAAAGGPAVGGIAVDAGGMVQPPAGAPAAVAQVIAAGNAIATLPYIWGGGHGSFQASGYDCSGSVSYALAAAGLLSSPLDSTGFESWGAPGPGRWITVYANADHAFMVVAGWRFDTVALASGGTRWSQSMAAADGFVVRHPPGL